MPIVASKLAVANLRPQGDHATKQEEGGGKMCSGGSRVSGMEPSPPTHIAEESGQWDYAPPLQHPRPLGEPHQFHTTSYKQRFDHPFPNLKTVCTPIVPISDDTRSNPSGQLTTTILPLQPTQALHTHAHMYTESTAHCVCVIMRRVSILMDVHIT